MTWRVLLGLLLATTALAARPEGPRDPARRPVATARAADARLRAGLPQLAVRIAEACLAERPEQLDCAEVLGRAASYAGHCAQALDALHRARDGGARWTVRSALAEGVCRVRLEDLEGALAAFDEASRLDPDDHGPWLQRALVDVRLGRLDAVDADLAGLAGVQAPWWTDELVELWKAWSAGDTSVDGLVADARRVADELEVPALRQHAALVDCLRWIEVGDPFRAEVVAREGNDAVGGNARLHACRGEAVRLQGDPYLAERLVDRDSTGLAATPVLDAVLVRALADQGRLDDAGRVLARQADPHAPVTVASAWYLARARHDEAAMRRLEAEARTLPAVPERDLRTLIPVAP